MRRPGAAPHPGERRFPHSVVRSCGDVGRPRTRGRAAGVLPGDPGGIAARLADGPAVREHREHRGGVLRSPRPRLPHPRGDLRALGRRGGGESQRALGLARRGRLTAGDRRYGRARRGGSGRRGGRARGGASAAAAASASSGVAAKPSTSPSRRGHPPGRRAAARRSGTARRAGRRVRARRAGAGRPRTGSALRCGARSGARARPGRARLSVSSASTSTAAGSVPARREAPAAVVTTATRVSGAVKATCVGSSRPEAVTT